MSRIVNTKYSNLHVNKTGVVVVRMDNKIESPQQK